MAATTTAASEDRGRDNLRWREIEIGSFGILRYPRFAEYTTSIVTVPNAGGGFVLHAH